MKTFMENSVVLDPTTLRPARTSSFLGTKIIPGNLTGSFTTSIFFYNLTRCQRARCIRHWWQEYGQHVLHTGQS